MELPDVDALTGRGDSPLLQAPDFVRTSCPACGNKARRETDTMDTFVDSSWYFYRYCDPRNDEAPFGRAAVKHWAPIDFYCGGVEHAILHLIYSRFFCKVLRDLGLIDHDEPFTRLLTQGMVLRDGAVMSKSKGNVIDPDEMLRTHGADALRLYEMFVAPPEKDIEWTNAGMDGSARFLGRVWRLVMTFASAFAAGRAPAIDGLPLGGAERALRRKTHDTIRRVSEDLDPRVHLNTAVSALMELVNELYAFCERAAIGPFAPRGGEAVAGAAPAGPRRGPRGDRGSRAHAVALRAPSRRGAVGGHGACRGRRRGGLAGVRSRRGARGYDCPAGAGQRQGPGAADRRGGRG